MEIRYSEIFFSMQGEAEYAGTPAVWLRFFGCNLNCSGFGQKNPTDPSTYELPYKEFDENSVKSVNDLPVWKFGCDSSYSWAAKFRHLAQKGTVEEVCDRLIDALRSPTNPDGLFLHPETGQRYMLCFTGGEPLLYQKAIMEIVEELILRGNIPGVITIETNGTQRLKDDFNEMLLIHRHYDVIKWHFAVSPKLFNVSGEKNVILPEVFLSYTRNASSVCLKFVVNGTEAAWKELDNARGEIHKILDFWRDPDIYLPPIWIMPVGADVEAQSNIGDLCIEAMQRGYKIATRNHVAVWGNAIGR